MGRPLRIEYPGAFYHVTSRGNERRAIFQAKKDYERFLGYFESATERYGAQIHCFCLMPNHYHLLLETPRGNLHQILHHINTGYTNYFNARIGRVGHLFQGRYRAILIDKDSYALELSRYIHLNPVRAHLVEDPSKYPWSSYLAYVGGRPRWDWLRTDFILGQMGSNRRETQGKYRAYIGEETKRRLRDPLEGVVASTLLGSESFIQWVKKRWMGGITLHRDVPALRKFVSRPELSSIKEKVERVFGKETFGARRVALYLSHRFSGLPLGEIGKFFGIGPSGVSQNTRRVNVLLKEDKKLFKEVEKLKEIVSE